MLNWNTIALFLTICSICITRCLNIEIGNTMDLLKDYGFLNRILREESCDDNTALRTEFLHNIFNKSSLINRTSIEVEGSFSSGLWSVELCDDLTQLLQTIFRNYQIELVDNTQKAFTSNWSFNNLATFLGLTDTSLLRNFSYLLVKYEKFSKHVKIREHQLSKIDLEEKILSEIESIRTDDERSTVRFLSHFGSHFVSSYSCGDAVFQTFVYTRNTGEHFKKLKDNEKLFRHELAKYALIYAIRVGDIRSLSGNRYLEEWLKTELKDTKFSNIFVMFNNTQFTIKEGYRLNRNIPLRLKFSAVSSVLKNREKSIWLSEIIDNQMKLRELYLRK